MPRTEARRAGFEISHPRQRPRMDAGGHTSRDSGRNGLAMAKSPNKNRVLEGIPIKAEHIVMGLLEQLMKMGKMMAAMRSELDYHMNMIAELQPKLRKDGRVSLLAMKPSEDGYSEVIVTVSARPLTEEQSTVSGDSGEKHP